MVPWSGRTPRRWQAEALPVALNAIRQKERGVVTAVMGAGKTSLTAEICASGRGRVLVTVPTQRLVTQTAATIEERIPGDVGEYWQDSKQADRRITVCCTASLPTLLNEAANYALHLR